MENSADVFDAHVAHELGDKDLDATMQTMIECFEMKFAEGGTLSGTYSRRDRPASIDRHYSGRVGPFRHYAKILLALFTRRHCS